MYEKKFKDPIYGYIEIASDIVAAIIDTPVFQRLKDIRQTSYTPLYPAAYHKSNFFHLFYKPKAPIEKDKKKQIVNALARKLIRETDY